MSKEKIYFRYDKIRLHQDKLIKDICSAVSEQKILLAHAPMGIGKSDAAISAALSYAINNDLSVFFLTPKISQHKIAVDVVKGLSKKYDIKIRGIDMLGRKHACIDSSLKDLDHEAFYQSCQKKRKNEQCSFYGNARGYNKMQETKANMLFGKVLKEYENIKTHHELVGTGELYNSCPYEWMIKIAAVSNIIIADYFHLMTPGIREIFLKKINKSMEKSIIIVDEAHNLAKRMRDQLSATINSFVLRRAEKELKFVGIPMPSFENEFVSWSEELLEGKKEKSVEREDLSSFVSSFNMESSSIATYFENAGIEFIEKTNKKSACLRISKFFENWEKDEESTIRILKKKGAYVVLSKKFLDPSIATSVLNQSNSAILMSGTLLPLEMHRDVLGLDPNKVMMKSYSSPFSTKNTINLISEGITTQYSKRSYETYKEIAGKIDSIIENSPPEIAIYFSSYIVMNSVVPLMNSASLLVQKEKSNPKEIGDIISEFSKGMGILCAVQGGSMAEGIDFCNNEIKTAIIVGIALDQPDLETEARISYYQEKFGKGWEYGYTYPATIKAVQAAGRCIRKETDRAAIVFMDERFKWKNYRNILDSDERTFIITKEPERYVKEFWAR